MSVLSGKLGGYSIWEWIVLAFILVPTTVSDISRKSICLWYGMVTVLCALITSIIFKENVGDVIAGLLPGLFLGVCSVALKKTIGMGDAVILLAVGAAIGMERTFSILFLALLATLPVSMFLLVVKQVKRDYSLPFVPFLLVATVYFGVMK